MPPEHAARARSALAGDGASGAARMIADGAIERDGVAGLARQLGYSERQLSYNFV